MRCSWSIMRVLGVQQMTSCYTQLITSINKLSESVNDMRNKSRIPLWLRIGMTQYKKRNNAINKGY